MTGQELCELALEEIGVLGEGETADADTASSCLRRANLLIDELFLDRQWLHRVNRVTKTLAAGTASYTIGSGGSINTVRPIFIDSAKLIIDTGAATPTEIDLDILTDQRWQDEPQKTLQSSLSQAIYYDHDWSAGLGLIYPWPIPNVGTTALVLNLPGVHVTEFADLTTDYTFAPGYKSALIANLAKRLTTPFGKALSAELQERAVDTLARVKRANHRPREQRGEFLTGRRGGWYDIRTNR
jgi:hypothetical protein